MNAIITAATGYTEADLQIFLWSVARNCQDTVVFLIVYRRDRKSIEKLQSKYPFIRPVYIDAFIRKQFARLANYRTRPYVTWLALQLSKRNYSSTNFLLKPFGKLAIRIIHERFFIAFQILKSNRNVFSKVLLTDCRDVVIQRDPFSFSGNKLFSGLEPEIIRNEKYTFRWIESVYGQDILNRSLDKPVICAGVTLGSAEKVENYLLELCNEMWKHLPQMIFKDCGYDQAAHIYLAFEKQFELELTSNHQGIIATISLENPSKFTIDFGRGLVEMDNQCPAIIHQYDRHPELLNFFKEAAS